MSDALDNRIVQALVRNGRASFSQIAAEVGLSGHAVAQRVRRLERLGVIRGYTARLDQGRMGRTLAAFIDVRLLPTADPETFERFALGLAAVQRLVFVTGRFDYIVELACRDSGELNETVRRLRGGGSVAATETRIVMRASDPA